MLFRLKLKKPQKVTLAGLIISLVVCLGYILRIETQVSHTEVQSNIGFLNVHTAGPSILFNIFIRYALRQNLTIALPIEGNVIKKDFNNLVPLRFASKHNMLLNHVKKFERWKFEQVLHWNTTYVAVVRDPLDPTMVAFQHYHQLSSSRIYSDIPGENKLREYLNHLGKYDPIPNWNSYTNNNMALDFGIPVKQMRNLRFIEEYLKQLESEIDLVLVFEFLDESLILLRRLLGWKIKDMLYLTLDSNKKREKLNFTEAELNYHRNFSLADNMLYEHFMERFKEKVEAAGERFQSEVNVFKTIVTNVRKYCQSIFDKPELSQNWVIQRTTFSEPFMIWSEDCKNMHLSENALLNIYRNDFITENKLD